MTTESSPTTNMPGTIGQRIRFRREALRLTQHQLAKVLGLTPQHISAVEQDKRSPSLNSLAKMAEELGVTTDYLITGKEGTMAGIIPAIKANTTLRIETKNALITLVSDLSGYQKE